MSNIPPIGPARVARLQFALREPDFEELLRFVDGTEPSGPLTEAERQRIREEELARVEGRYEAAGRLPVMPYGGAVVGNCRECGREMYQFWRFCGYCGAASGRTCRRCSSQLPGEAGVRFCPECGAPVAG